MMVFPGIFFSENEAMENRSPALSTPPVILSGCALTQGTGGLGCEKHGGKLRFRKGFRCEARERDSEAGKFIARRESL